MNITQKLKQKALEIGFSRVGICSVGPGDEVGNLRDWISKGFHGQMKYMENSKRISPREVLPWL